MPRTCPVEWVEAEHPLFLLYTSGSTGKPKGVLHTTGGYMVGVGGREVWGFTLPERTGRCAHGCLFLPCG